MENATSQKYLTLSNGVKMPIIGLGTWQISSSFAKDYEIEEALKIALNVGYRHFDTSKVHENEKNIGKVLNDYFDNGLLTREDVFITTKLWINDAHEEEVEPALKKSLERLRLDYVDLYLIHMPGCVNKDMTKQDPYVAVTDTWKGMEKVYDKGLAKAIGVSNFNAEQVERIQKGARVPIHNNQVELHLHFAQHELHEVCKRLNIVITAYAPLGSPGRVNSVLPNGTKNWPPGVEPLKNRKVNEIAEKYVKTPAQILLRHLIQRDIVVIPKSLDPKHIRENFQIFDFELTDEEFNALESALPDPRLFLENFYLFGHPEFPFKDEIKL